MTYELGQYPVLTEYGFTDTPGRWDHWPGGFLATQGNDQGVNGKVVVDQGDILFPFKRYVQEPIEFTIREGQLGGTNDTACHLDLPMKGCTLYLDDELIVKDGDIVPKDLRAPGR